jgi:hypothetical protein
VYAEEEDEGAQGCDPAGGEAREHHDRPREQRPDRGDEGEQACLMMNAPGMPMTDSPMSPRRRQTS